MGLLRGLIYHGLTTIRRINHCLLVGGLKNPSFFNTKSLVSNIYFSQDFKPPTVVVVGGIPGSGGMHPATGGAAAWSMTRGTSGLQRWDARKRQERVGWFMVG